MTVRSDRSNYNTKLNKRLKTLKKEYQKDVSRVNDSKYNYFVFIHTLRTKDHYLLRQLRPLTGYSEARISRIVKIMDKKLKGGENT